MRESRIDKETHSAMLKHYYQKQEEEKKMREDDDDSYMESNFFTFHSHPRSLPGGSEHWRDASLSERSRLDIPPHLPTSPTDPPIPNTMED